MLKSVILFQTKKAFENFKKMINKNYSSVTPKRLFEAYLMAIELNDYDFTKQYKNGIRGIPRDIFFNKAIYLAIESNRKKILRSLLASKNLPEKIDCSGLDHYLDIKQWQEAKEFINKVKKFQIIRHEYNHIIVEAIESKDLELIKMLVLKGFNYIDSIALVGTPLERAIEFKSLEIAEYLLTLPGVKPSPSEINKIKLMRSKKNK